MLPFLKFKRFSPLPTEDIEEKESFLGHSTLLPLSWADTSVTKTSWRSAVATIGFNIVVFILAIGLLKHASTSRANVGAIEKNDILKKTNFYSPILDFVDIPYVTKQMNATLFDNYPPTIYRGDPSPEVDAAWNKLIQVHTIAVDSDAVRRLGKNHTRTARYPESFGLGKSAHIAQIDVIHQIHCLDMLRQAVHHEYYRKEPKTHAYNAHNEHCLHLLLQNFMCTASVDMITYTWVDGQRLPFPDFNINKKCRNFDAIMGWHKDHHVDVEMYRIMHAPPDAVVEPESMDFPGYGVDVTGLTALDIEIY